MTIPSETLHSPLPGMVLFLPLASALTILLLHRLLRSATVLISLGSSLACFIISLMLLGANDGIGTIVPFIKVGAFHANIGFIIDQQSRGMLFIVTFIGFLVHLYSVGYMKDDDAKPRFFGSLSLFMFSMTGIVLADSFPMIFIFWELVGLSSYLLIGHWFQKASAAEAAKKAFLTNRIGDFGFMIGILLLFAAGRGVTSFADLQDSLANGVLKDAPQWLLTAAALGVFMGAVGKSAQVPLHVWLPDAMEGPTPVSALIHAATMVAAGVYMLVRVSFILNASPFALQIISGVGAVTALFAALMALQQNDIKRILAYSTLSQLGYMVMAVGLKAGDAGMFHLYTHAFFKALLFLGSGAVIHACHHEQDIWKMGGLKDKTQVTFVTFAVGTLALIGFPFTSGFWSKEGILTAAYNECGWCFALAAFTALLTAFYMTRCVVVTFLGKARTESASHAHEAPLIMIAPLMLLAVFAIASAYGPFTNYLQPLMPEHSEGHESHVPLIASLLALIIGAGSAFVLYNGKDKDPINLPLLANKFYIDEIYAVIVKYAQDRLAWVVTALDSIFADGLVARLPAAIACRLGKTARSLQSGQLQGYTLVLGIGLVLAIYLAVFVVQKH
jgi:NADH-quinone oxidoreductase subunit L